VLETEVKSLREKELKLSRTQSDQDIEKKLQTVQKQVADLKQQLARQNIDPEEVAGARLEIRLSETEGQLNQVNKERRQILQNYHHLDFTYE